MVVPEVEELVSGDPETIVKENARRKQLEVAGSGIPATTGESPLVIGADTIVVLGGRIYGKPAGRGEAESMLRQLAGREHQVLTGVAVGERSAVATTGVLFRALDEAILEWYLDSEEWRGRAGAYAIQGRGAALVDAVHGDYLNVVGLPVATLLQLEPRFLTQG